MKHLIGIRLKALFHSMRQSFGGKNKGTAAMAVFGIIAIALSVEMTMFVTWSQFAVFLDTEYSWLFLSMAALMAFAVGIFTTVFTTQNQMYHAKDNELLLAMPIKPSAIIGSRVVVLYLLTFVFVVAVMGPAGMMYGAKKGFSVGFVVAFVIGMVLISLLTQAVTCLLGWLLHFLLAGVKHKAILATVFLTVVMVLYLYGVSKLEDLMLLLVNNGGKVASAVQSFAWPFYAFGVGCSGNYVQFVLFAVASLAVFGLVTVILSVTFVKAMLTGGKSKGATKQKREDAVRTPIAAICRKERKRFFSSTTYLINIGMGLFMTVASVIAAIVLRGEVMPILESMLAEMGTAALPAVFVEIMGFMAALTPITAPSVSLEGKQLWIMRTMPVCGATILKAKLRFHCIVSVPVAAVGSLALGIAYGIGLLETMGVMLGATLMFVLGGLLGLIFNLCFPRFDWDNEAQPVKQSLAVLFTMFGMILLCIVFIGGAVGLMLLLGASKAWVAIYSMIFLFCVIVYVLYRVMITWGGRKFETL